MPLIKPVFTATSTTPVATGGAIGTVVTPAATRFFATVAAGDVGPVVTTITAASFVDDANAPVVDLPTLTSNEYFNVYVNGVLQQKSLSTVSPASLVLDTNAIAVGVPVSLEVASFANVASSITTQPTISTPVITIVT
ncbi:MULTISPECIES: DUF4183 domain-containing protein [unclassified Paenibacillus]|uniref:DUF4183 domain-containing protein n=1 Tax=unclassified Paenibacillus TaxID=185978 RepID=UPI0024051C04|nr:MULTISPECIES: DUF4183 domain-containing protein [unclassified Paenibacillus]MDF9841467.1 hypothetical protein [Paenibacillus sp. PastF-2]MDF9848057.1 hypothetical protein [Paenibacillus sp. PastM-2]MDF9854626.1 hypothetical protein [Paenibacillus sp. PastF-1]MDH6479766.1 hypothetical protein [Paenibacillus sp. PastH-2]MDH6507332.1 hypothetical protein [Paenibacillus sp. PastM-3]